MRSRVAVLATIALVGCYGTHDQPDGAVDAAADTGTGDAEINGCLPLPREVAFWAHLCLGPSGPINPPSWCLGAPSLDPERHDILPVSASIDGTEVLVEAVLISSARWPELPDGSLRASLMRYRIRPTELGPLLVLEGADPLSLESALRMWDARDAARTAGAPPLCVRVGEMEIWLDRKRDHLGADSAVLEPNQPLMWAGLMRSRTTDQLWALFLQLNPLRCAPETPCGPQELAADGAWVVFGSSAGSVAAPEDPRVARRPWGCVLQPNCELRESGDTFRCSWWTGSLRCDDEEWLDRACAARSLDELPPLDRWPCHTSEEDLTCPALCPP